MRVHCDTCGWNGEGEHIIEPGDCHRIDYIEDKVEMAKPGLSHNRETGRIGFNTKFNPMISWIRARIPLPISLGLAAACKDALNNGHAPIVGGKSE